MSREAGEADTFIALKAGRAVPLDDATEQFVKATQSGASA